MPSVFPKWRRLRASGPLVFYLMVSLFLPGRILNLSGGWQRSQVIFRLDLGVTILMAVWWFWVTITCLKLLKASIAWILPLSAPLLLASIAVFHSSRAWHIVGTVALAAAIIPPLVVLRLWPQKISDLKSGEDSGTTEA